MKRLDFDEMAAYADARAKLMADFAAAYTGELLRRSKGNVSAAARLAGMDRGNFNRLRRKGRS